MIYFLDLFIYRNKDTTTAETKGSWHNAKASKAKRRCIGARKKKKKAQALSKAAILTWKVHVTCNIRKATEPSLMCCCEKVFFFTEMHVLDYKQETVGINSILKWVCKKKWRKSNADKRMLLSTMKPASIHHQPKQYRQSHWEPNGNICQLKTRQWALPWTPISMSLDYERKPECPQTTHAGTGKTYKLLTERLQLASGFKPKTCCEMTVLPPFPG